MGDEKLPSFDIHYTSSDSSTLSDIASFMSAYKPAISWEGLEDCTCSSEKLADKPSQQEQINVLMKAAINLIKDVENLKVQNQELMKVVLKR